MGNKIVVIGGYGHIGQKICLDLVDDFSGNIYAAGRDEKKAKKFAHSTNGSVHPLYIDVTRELPQSFFNDVQLVIMCVEQISIDFVEKCLVNGVNYIDITASYAFIEQVELLNYLAVKHEATAVKSVGLAPGMTNLLACKVVEELDVLNEIDLFLLLGLGDEHGKEAIRWTLHNIKGSFKVNRAGKPIRYQGFTDGKKTDFGGEIGKKKAYRFNFADQHVLEKKFGVPVSSRLCFDSNFITKSIHLLKRSKILHILPESFLLFLFKKMNFGKADFAIGVEASGMKLNEKRTLKAFVRGREEAHITALVTSIVAKSICKRKYSSGVWNMEQLFQWEEMYKPLQSLLDWELSQ